MRCSECQEKLFHDRFLPLTTKRVHHIDVETDDITIHFRTKVCAGCLDTEFGQHIETSCLIFYRPGFCVLSGFGVGTFGTDYSYTLNRENEIRR